MSNKDPETSWGTPLPPTYGPDDAPAARLRQDLGAPGAFPYTRGIHAEMYRKRLWTMRQYAGFGSAAETNKRYRFLLEQGQTGLSVAFDLPTQMGYDPDAPMARGEVGRVGVSIATLEDTQDLFEGIPLDRVSTSMTINATASVLLALYLATARRQGVAPAALAGTVQNDILKEYIARGTYIFPPGPSMRLITDTFAYCTAHVPRWNTISISGYHMREAGCTAVQEVAFTLANGMAYVRAALEAGLTIDDFAPQLSFFFNAHNNLLEEVAKFRAARRLWARLMRDTFQARDPRSLMLRFHAQTAGSMLTAQQPENNIVRVTVQALAAVLGGCQSLHTNSMDEALALPTERAVRIALRTQQVLAWESGVADVVDPLGGAFALERLTADIEEAATAYLRRIEELGGAVSAIAFMQREIQDAAYRYQREIEDKTRIVVGVNEFVTEEVPPANLFRVDPSVGDALAERLGRHRAARRRAAADAALDALERAARGRANLVPLMVEAVEAGATLGEICERLRGVFGVHQPSVTF
ncbi:MAG: methylmalonyl-CoA mutase [Candidatus Rokubacteria bacterium RIFCSPHIGHO2_12_FULL_73_22]|nr:MAG: methylmalonyl-CoA mutase [Candidatus Rokubacteria bacterium RIFCSPHIGHO2_12_FULL_73_22]OGL10730.1 MAG: methylmalonyl-CoA mutase [Candidatus Rokubacteria bacterium RIFCSPLOWO2_02_FULL_73_56]OGL20977.1 MAG: methylmalonyl-CoA mutase [Candidatus Rokubacteria bacterium RIFCSPLOWO2_12_FULL_73_47]